MWEKFRFYIGVFLTGMVAGALLLFSTKYGKNTELQAEYVKLEEEGKKVEEEIKVVKEEIEDIKVEDLNEQEVVDYWKKALK